MYKILVFLLLSFAFQSTSKAQDKLARPFKIGITGGVAFFFEDDLKDINSKVKQDLPFTVETINNFPPSLCYGGYFLVPVSSGLSVGPSYQFYTTGSRLGAKDYSATYSFDQTISAHSLGIQFEFLLTKNIFPAVYFESTAGVHLASWKLKEKITTEAELSADKQKADAVKPYLYPGFKFSWPLNSSFGIAVKAGYSFDLGGKFSFDNYPDAQSDTKVSFSGPRLTAAFEFGF